MDSRTNLQFEIQKGPAAGIYGSNASRATPLQCSARLEEIYINSIDREYENEYNRTIQLCYGAE